MTKKLIIIGIIGILLIIAICLSIILRPKSKEEIPVEEEKTIEKSKLYYLGHASLRIVTSEGKVIYIDPYMGNDYDMPADLVLVTHAHYDHNEVSKVKNRSADFKLITNKEALVNGGYQTFNLGYAKIEAVPAGYNKFHSEFECVGYIITLSDNVKLYVAGDTSITPKMSELSSLNIDYAFIPCDGTYTMTTDEAVKASEKINARYSIPYHTASDGRDFDINVANSFNVQNRLIIKPKEEIILTHGGNNE